MCLFLDVLLAKRYDRERRGVERGKVILIVLVCCMVQVLVLVPVQCFPILFNFVTSMFYLAQI